jgi:hypothetical protein
MFMLFLLMLFVPIYLKYIHISVPIRAQVCKGVNKLGTVCEPKPWRWSLGRLPFAPLVGLVMIKSVLQYGTDLGLTRRGLNFSADLGFGKITGSKRAYLILYICDHK